MRTKVFKSGNSLAIRIPKDLSIADTGQDVEIERVGNTLTVRPIARKSLAGIGAIFAMFSPDFMARGREVHVERERDWNPRIVGSDVAERPSRPLATMQRKKPRSKAASR